MLRSIKTSRAAARLVPFRYEMNSTPAFEQGEDDFLSLTDNGTGDATLTFIEPFRRLPVVLASANGDHGAAGAAAALGAASTKSTARIVGYSASGAGAAADGTVDCVAVGWDSPVEHDAGFPQRVVCTNVSPRVIALRLSGPGTLVEGKYQATVSAASNVSTISLKNPFATPPVVLVTPAAVGNTAAKVSATSKVITIEQFTHADAAATDGLHVVLIGQDQQNRVGKLRRTLRATQMRPRLIAGIVSQSGGTYSVASGYSDLGSVTKNGTGDITLTFEKAFMRSPVVIVTPRHASGLSAAVTSVSTTACTIKTNSFANVATDATALNVFVLGFDYISQV